MCSSNACQVHHYRRGRPCLQWTALMQDPCGDAWSQPNSAAGPAAFFEQLANQQQHNFHQHPEDFLADALTQVNLCFRLVAASASREGTLLSFGRPAMMPVEGGMRASLTRWDCCSAETRAAAFARVA